MGDLYSMAYEHSSMMSSHGGFTSLGGWDNNLHHLHHHHHHNNNLGILNSDMPTRTTASSTQLTFFSFAEAKVARVLNFLYSTHCLKAYVCVMLDCVVMDISGSSAPFFSSLDSDPSSGYLEDALIEFRDQSKRRRVMLYTDDHHHEAKAFESVHYAKSFPWNSDCIWDLPENFNWMMSGETSGCFHNLSDSEDAMKECRLKVEQTVFEGMKKKGVAISVPEAEATIDSPSSWSYSSSVNNTMSISDKSSSTTADAIPYSGEEEAKRNKRVITRIVYPFALVKPGGDEGVVTLNDINERIMMPPTRPVKHPVGEYACRSCISPDGLGISGKAVVALTRIQTQGSGTITIIRTKG